ncbi:urease accessory protein UreD [Catellatospora methionotrophica]|uniref:Urease accessory protein UreD n=1 Tax=Catellatospora methionotrophica TaxID=121620 RepID=A0A8J3PI85_9ACTN|nr:urease accessory protein UreD [Catellatospora methionotrophica]GIG18182.1 urease accessory protein UreD [Catellatospora methionotrophica]
MSTAAPAPPRHPLDGLPQLADYQDQPAQQPAGAVGKDAYLRLGFARRGERTVLADLHRRAPLLVQQALYFDEGMPDLPCVFMISTSGGILQGDRYAVDITLDPGAQAHVTTQAATKIQQMDANYATMVQDITLAAGSYLEFLPDPIIPYRDSRYASRTRLCVAADATALYAEILLPGRKHHRDGEIFAYRLYSAAVQGVRPDGRELFAENLVIEPGTWPVDAPGLMGGYHVLANAILMTPPETAARVAAQAPVGHTGTGDDRTATGISVLPNDAGLIYKVLGMETEPVRAQVRAFWSVVRREVTGNEVPDNFRWR